MSYPLYWTPSDFEAGGFLHDLGALSEFFGGEPVRYYDYWGAEKPEDAMLPMSYWSKKRILFYVDHCDELRKAGKTLAKMKLDDLRASALMKVANRPRGRIYTKEAMADHEYRNTDFYALDCGWIKKIAEAGA